MLFHTWTFCVFLLIVFAVYVPLRRTRYFPHWLLLASYVFYGWWNWAYLVLIAYSTVIDYCAVNAMARNGRRKAWLWLSIVNNLSVLALFKYSTFLIANANRLAAVVRLPVQLPLPADLLPVGWEFVLPVGISFYTFQSMSYTIDFYRGQVEREPSLVRYAAFVSLFPQLVAGPIERARNLLRQLAQPPPVTANGVAEGGSLFLLGLFKKVAVADYLAGYVDQVYAVPELYNAPALMLATFAFSWQIYCDFSGYTDMARGVARIMGLNLMLNFDNPYAASGLADFWQRWHISLSSWFRDYVYIPLGGSRRGARRTYVNVLVTMLVSGLWHGAAWTFVLWGLAHALGLMATRALTRTWIGGGKIPQVLRQMAVFAFVSLTWVLFRSATLGDAATVYARMVTTPWTNPQFPLTAGLLCAALWAYQFTYESRVRFVLENRAVRLATAVYMALHLALFASSRGQAFIYFQF